MRSAPPSQGSGSDAADNQTKAPVAELGQKFWTWAKSDASDANVAASQWDISGATPLNSLLAADSSLGFQSLEAKAHLAVAGSLPVQIVSAGSSGTSVSTPSVRARPTNGEPAPAANAEPQSASASASSSPRQQGDADASAGKRDDFAASTASATSAIDASGGVAMTSATSLPVSGLADFIAGEAEAMSTPPSADASSGAAGATPQAPGASKIKELVISLEPENLGQISLRLRLSNGKLSVSIGVANPQTLAAIEDESSAIASRLAGGQQSLESLTIHPQEGSITDAGNSGTGDFSGFRAPADRNSEGQDLSPGGARKPAYQPQNSSGAMAGGNADLLIV
jgi:flagellar hook-length control protein FliK